MEQYVAGLVIGSLLVILIQRIKYGKDLFAGQTRRGILHLLKKDDGLLNMLALEIAEALEDDVDEQKTYEQIGRDAVDEMLTWPLLDGGVI